MLNSSYLLGGDSRWHHIQSVRGSVFTDSDAGLVPPPGHLDENYFLNADGEWIHTSEVVDSDITLDALRALRSRWDSENRELDIYASYTIPAIPGEAGRNAWLICTVTANPVTNSGNDRDLTSSAILTLRYPPNAAGETYPHINIPIRQVAGLEYPPRGTTAVAQLIANNIADHYSSFFIETDIGEGDGQFSVQLQRPGFMDTDSSADAFVEEFVDPFYTISTRYAVPGSERGYPADSDARGIFPTAAIPAKDSEVDFIIQQLPLFDSDSAGLVPAYRMADTDTAFLSAKGRWMAPSETSTITVGVDNTDDTDSVTTIHFPYSDIVDGATGVVSVVTHGARPHQTGVRFSQGELVFAETARTQLYVVVANTTNAPALTDTSVFQPLVDNTGGGTDIKVGPGLSIKDSDSDVLTLNFGGTPSSESLLGYNAGQGRPQWQSTIGQDNLPNNVVNHDKLDSETVSPNHMATGVGATNIGTRGYIPVSAGTGDTDGWLWTEEHQNFHLPAAEEINDPATHDVFRVPATGVQSMQKGTVPFTTFNVASAWGIIDRQDGLNTIFIDTPPTTWQDIASGANYNSFAIANGAGGFPSGVDALLDTSDPASNGLVWFRNTDSDWGIFQWPSRSLNQSGTGAIYTSERNLKLVAYEGFPDSDMQVGFNIRVTPVRIDSDFIRVIMDPEWYLGADDIWHDGYDMFERRGEVQGVKSSLERLEKILSRGIGEAPIKEEGRFTGRLDFTSWRIAADGNSITFFGLDSDDDAWSAFDDLFDDQLYPTDGVASIHLQLAYQKDPTDTDFYDTDLAIETAQDGTNEIFEDSEGTGHTKITFAITNNANSRFRGANRLVFTDGQGTVLNSTPAGKTGGKGYFRHMYAYATDGRYADLTEQIEEIGIANYTYISEAAEFIPYLKDSDSEFIVLPLSLGDGLTRTGDTLSATVGSLSPTEYFHYARNPSRFIGVFTNGNVTHVHFAITSASNVTTQYTIFYTRNDAGVIQTAVVYPGTLGTPTGTAVATRQYTVSGGSTTWIDS